MAREYGPGLGYPPVVTAILAGFLVLCGALAVIGYLGFRYSWWTPAQFRWVIKVLSRGKSERPDSEEPPK
jgi:hypothetical protein